MQSGRGGTRASSLLAAPFASTPALRGHLSTEQAEGVSKLSMGEISLAVRGLGLHFHC